MHQLDEVRTALASHPVVALIGARGTAKSTLATKLGEDLEANNVRVVQIDARSAESPADLNIQIAEALRCPYQDLSGDAMLDGDVVRIIVDNAHAFYDRKWFPYLQEQWRALLSSESARGRVAMLLLGRPLFRSVAGGDGSPLLGIGPVLVARPMTPNEVVDAFDVEMRTAEAVCRKTGGHPALTLALLDAIERDSRNIGSRIDDFVRQQERYLLKLAEDHTLAALGMLADVVRSGGPCAEATLVATHFGDTYADGQEALRDLAASGLVLREGDKVTVRAELVVQVRAVRDFIRVPRPDIPIESPRNQGPATDAIFEIENRLRRKIVEELGAVDETWWPSRIPNEFVAGAELRRRTELDSAAAPDKEQHPLMYLSMGELFEVILLNENWTQVFGITMHRSREMVRAAGRDVMAVRNKVAHSRPVTDTDYGLLVGAAERLGLWDRATA